MSRHAYRMSGESHADYMARARKNPRPKSGDVRVDGLLEALVVLMDEWPNLRAGYVKARSLCRAAIAGRKDAEEARENFVVAAKEANLLH